MSHKGGHVEINIKQNSDQPSPPEPNKNEATGSLEQRTVDKVNPANVDETAKQNTAEKKPNEQIEIEIDQVKAKASPDQKKSAKEVLLIDIYGAQNPESGNTGNAVPCDRLRVDGVRQTRGYRMRVQTFFMSGQDYGPGGGYDYEAADPATRNVFVQKVFGLVFIMLLVTSVLVGIAYNSEEMRQQFRGRSILAPLLGAAVVLMFLSCVMPSDCARVPPCNFVCLLLTVLCMSFIGAVITCRYTAISVVLALVITTLLVLMCLALACTKFDFTKFLIYVLAAMAVLFLCSIAYMVLRLCGVYVPGMQMVLLVVGTLIQTFVLIIELQMILGGKAVEMSENDYALGAFMLYSSIMQLFLNILQIFGEVE